MSIPKIVAGRSSHYQRIKMKTIKTKNTTKTFVINLVLGPIKLLISLLIIFALGVTFLSRNQGIYGLRSFIISTGSMNPSIPPSSFVVTQTQSSYQVGDIVTFFTYDQNGNRQMLPTTHRIVSVNNDSKLTYQTKGDANQDADSTKILPQNIIGKVIFTLPRLGKFIDFIQSSKGRMLFILFPAVSLFYYELSQILKDLKKLKKPNTIIILLFLLLLLRPTKANAFFDDQENLDQNSISTAVLDIAVSQTQTLTLKDDSYFSDVQIKNLAPVDPVSYMLTANLKSGTSVCLSSPLIMSLNGLVVFDDTIDRLNLFTHPDFIVADLQTLSLEIGLPSSPVDQTCSFEFSFLAWHQGFTPDQSFTDTESFTDEFFVPMNIISTSITQENYRQIPTPLDIAYNSVGATMVDLCYSFNLGEWTCDQGYTDYPNSPGSISFDFPMGNGMYYFITYGFNSIGQKEIKPLPDPKLINPLDPSIYAVVKSPPDIDIQPDYSEPDHQLDILFSNTPTDFGDNPPDHLDYTINYQTSSGPKGGTGQITADQVSAFHTYQPPPYYLGSCSQDICTPDDIVDNSIIITLYGNIAYQPIYVEKVLNL